MTFRRRTWEILDGSAPDDNQRKVIDLFLITLIVLSVMAIILESVGSVYATHGALLDGFETFCIIVFTVEYALRIWSSVECEDGASAPHPTASRLAFVRSPMALIDLAAILPFFLNAFFPIIDLLFLRVFRLVRILKLTRYSKALSILLQVLNQERKSFAAIFFILMMVVIAASCGIYIFEHDLQPQAFGSIPAAMWWAIATLTTVGYGDVIPLTVGGKVFGGLMTIVGIGLVALPSGVLASGFVDVLRQREREYERQLSRALQDGVITEDEKQSLETLQKELNLSDETTKSLTQEAETLERLIHCPHCGEAIHTEPSQEQ